MEFRKQFATYFKTEMEVDMDSLTEDESVSMDNECEIAEEQEDEESEEEEEIGEWEEDIDVDQEEAGTMYFPVIPDALPYECSCSTSSALSAASASSTSHTCRTSAAASSSSSSPNPHEVLEDTCSRFKRMFTNIVIINDETDSSCDQCRDALTTYTTTYRVTTPLPLLHTATREITLASGLPAPVVSIVTDYFKHEMEGDTITAKYQTGSEAQTFSIKHNGKRLLALMRPCGHDPVKTDVWMQSTDHAQEHQQIEVCMQLFSRLGGVRVSHDDG